MKFLYLKKLIIQIQPKDQLSKLFKTLPFLFLFYCLQLQGQLPDEQKRQIDSLKMVISKAKHDTTIINAWIAWDNIIYISNPDLDFELNKKIDSLCSLNLSKSLNKKERKRFLTFKAFALNSFGMISNNIGDYEKALEHHKACLNIIEELDNEKRMASSYINIASVYHSQGNYAMAIDNFTKSLKIGEKYKDKNLIALSANNIGVMYVDMKDFTKALEYYERSLKLREELQDDYGIATSFNNIGIVYDELKEYDKAFDYYKRSLKICEEISDHEGTATALHNLATIHKMNKEYDKALNYYNRSYNIRKDLGDQNGVVSSLLEIGDIYKLQGNFQKALQNGNQSLKIAQTIQALPRIRDAAKNLFEINKKLGRSKESLEMFELYIQSRDSLDSDENQKELIRQEYKYQYEKQAAADSIRNAEEQKVADAELAKEKAENDQRKQQSYFLFGGLALVLVFAGFIFNRFRITKKQKEIIEDQKEKVDEAYEELEEKNTEIMDSITYAKRIQNAILPPDRLVKKHLPNSFVLYKPKDIVAGDFYWMEAYAKASASEGILIAAADCTGHGVPGAMVSVVCNNGLNRSVREFGLTDPGKILDKTRELVIQEFEKSEDTIKDGMDIALVSLEQEGAGYVALNSSTKLKFSGAHNPLWIIRKGVAEEIKAEFSAESSDCINIFEGKEHTLIEVKADKQPIGKFANPLPYTTHKIDLKPGDSIYIFSDGYADQFGGEKGKKFKTKNFKNLLLSVQKEPMEKQKELIDQAFEDWKGNLEQLDDVCVIGIQV